MLYKVYLVREEWWDEESEYEGHSEARHVKTFEKAEDADALMDKLYIHAHQNTKQG